MSSNIYTSAYRPYLPQINHRKINEQTQEEFSESTRGKQKAIQEYRNLPNQPQRTQQQYQLPQQQYQYRYQNQYQYQPQYQNIKQPYQYNNFNQNKQNQERHTPEVKNVVKSMNIQQILIDFKSTIAAIGASEEVEEEVKGYLDLIDKQTQKENPNKKVIVSNLKVCANLLDNYISETLNKPSKVVKDWVEALLMQPIDFKADKTLTKGAFETITGEPPQTARLAQEKLAQKEASSIQQQEEIIEKTQLDKNKEIQEVELPVQPEVTQEIEKPAQNSEIQNIIEKADDIKNDDTKSAMNLYSQAFKLAQKENNKYMMAQIYSKIGNLQNSTNNLIGALDCLNASTLLAYECGETELMADNHAQMGRIYDEKGMFEPAFNHYHRSVALNGELENLDKQTETLTQVGDMFSERYFANEALGYYDLALDMAKENKNYENASNIFRHCAKTNENSGKLQNAMNNLKNAAAISNNINDDAELASIYEQAGDMMKKMGHSKKAADLYKKAYRLAQKLDDKNMQDNIIAKMQ